MAPTASATHPDTLTAIFAASARPSPIKVDTRVDAAMEIGKCIMKVVVVVVESFEQLALLFQDTVGGLEIHDHEANIFKFRPVLPKPGIMIVHIGDMLERQSNGRWKSALHHVTGPSHSMYGQEPADMDSVVDRFAIAFYAHPDYEMKIEPLPGCEKKGQWKTLEWQDRMTAGDWMNKRVALEYEQPPIVAAA